MNRTNAIEKLCERLNIALGTPAAGWTRNPEGPMKANVGHVYCEQANGTRVIYQIVGESGGVRALGSVYGLDGHAAWAALCIALDVIEQAQQAQRAA